MTVETLYLGELAANCYIAKMDGDIVIIDPGAWCKELEAVVEKYKNNIKMVLLTHRHYDHIMGAAHLKELYNIPVAIHEEDSIGLTDPKASLFAMLGAASKQKTMTADHTLKDGDILMAGKIEIEVLHTPGHTAGGVCYIIDNILFSGDTLFEGNVGRTDLPTGDYAQLISSLKRLKALNGDYIVYTGHGPQTSLEKERKTNPYMGN